MKSSYDTLMKPLEKRGIKEARLSLIPEVHGKALEIGAGTGANLEFYIFDNIEKLTISDNQVSDVLIKKAQEKDIVPIICSATNLPFGDKTFDYVIHTLVFCSVNDVNKGLEEIKRVLKDDGTLIFIEHVLPKKKGLKKLFNLVNPAWSKFSSGCNINRDYETSLKNNNFNIVTINSFMNDIMISGIAKKKVD